MPEFGVVLEIDVFQRSAKMISVLHGLPDPVREMEVFQPMNIGGNRVSGHRIERDDQSDLQACLSEGLGHAERGACAKGMPDQYDRGYSPALAILQCFAGYSLAPRHGCVWPRLTGWLRKPKSELETRRVIEQFDPRAMKTGDGRDQAQC